MITLRKRRVLNGICVIDKIIKEDLKSELLYKIQELQYINIANIRDPPLFKNLHTLPNKSPLRIMLTAMNKYRAFYSNELTTMANRKNIMNQMINEN